MQRYQDWPSRMDDFLRQQHLFSWGVCDCALFAADHILNITGNDFATGFRGAYASAEGAQECLTRNGWDGLEAMATSFLGPSLPGVKKAQRGDIVLAADSAGGNLGIVDLTGRYYAAVTEAHGLQRFPLSAAALAWRV